MIIKLDTDYHIEVKNTYDLVKTSRVLDKKSKNYGNKSLLTVAYCSTFEQAIKRYINEVEMMEDMETSFYLYLKQHEERVEELLNRIKENVND